MGEAFENAPSCADFNFSLKFSSKLVGLQTTFSCQLENIGTTVGKQNWAATCGMTVLSFRMSLSNVAV